MRLGLLSTRSCFRVGSHCQGPSDTSGRAFSVLCGIVTIGLVYWIGLLAFDGTTGLWASWLCAISPLLVYYSREARMYMWLVLVTCLAWGLLFSHTLSPNPRKLVLYGAHSGCHCLLSSTGPVDGGCARAGVGPFSPMRSGSHGGAGSIPTFAVVLAVAPWLGQYLDHPPESTTGLLPLRYLLGMPIGFIGGNFSILLVCVLLIAYGLCEVRWQKPGRIRIIFEHPVRRCPF